MEHIDILNWIDSELYKAKSMADFEKEKIKRAMELVPDRYGYIANRLLEIDFETSAFGHYYIKSGYNVGKTNIRDTMARYYENNTIFVRMNELEKERNIKADAYNFLFAFELEQILRQLAKPESDEETDDEATMYYNKAIEAGIIERQGNGYKKKKGITKALLAYFLGKIFTPDPKKDGAKFPETKLNALFDEKRLGEAFRKLVFNKYANGKPKGYEKIDKLFEG